MKIERITDTLPVKIERFAEDHDLTMVVVAPCDALSPDYKAYFKGVEIIARDGFLFGLGGYGSTESDAINEYAKRISCKTIRITGGKRIDVPELAVYQNR